MRRPRAAEAAKSLLSNASRRLLTPDPTDLPEMRRALDESLDWSLGGRMPTHSTGPFEPSFSETRGHALAFQVSPGDDYAPRDRSGRPRHPRDGRGDRRRSGTRGCLLVPPARRTLQVEPFQHGHRLWRQLRHRGRSQRHCRGSRHLRLGAGTDRAFPRLGDRDGEPGGRSTAGSAALLYHNPLRPQRRRAADHLRHRPRDRLLRTAAPDGHLRHWRAPRRSDHGRGLRARRPLQAACPFLGADAATLRDRCRDAARHQSRRAARCPACPSAAPAPADGGATLGTAELRPLADRADA